MTSELDVLLNWERQGGALAVLDAGPTSATVALLRCDGGEEADRIVVHDPEAVALVWLRRGED